jgi:hypothetical protein
VTYRACTRAGSTFPFSRFRATIVLVQRAIGISVVGSFLVLLGGQVPLLALVGLLLLGIGIGDGWRIGPSRGPARANRRPPLGRLRLRNFVAIALFL